MNKRLFTIDGTVKLATLVFVVALTVRTGFVVWKGPMQGGDTTHYKILVTNLVQGHGYTHSTSPPYVPTIRRAPLYPVFLAGLWALAGQGHLDRLAALVQVVLDSLTATLIFLLGIRFLPTAYSQLAALFYAVFPAAVAYSATLLSETLFTFLLVAAVWALAHADSESNRVNAWNSLGATLLALAVLCRPIAVLLLPLLLGVQVAIHGWRKGGRPAVLACFAFLLILSPWLIRCYQVAGEFVFVQSTSSALFYVASLTRLNQVDETTLWNTLLREGTEDPYFRLLQQAKTPAEMLAADRFAVSQTFHNIKQSPREYIASRARYFPYLFLTSFDFVTGINQSFRALMAQGDTKRIALKLTLLLVFSVGPLCLATFGVIRMNLNLVAALSASVWLYFLVIHLPMWVEYRYWIPAVPFQLLSGAQGAWRLATVRFRQLA